jgi:hypothetical protein
MSSESKHLSYPLHLLIVFAVRVYCHHFNNLKHVIDGITYLFLINACYFQHMGFQISHNLLESNFRLHHEIYFILWYLIF